MIRRLFTLSLLLLVAPPLPADPPPGGGIDPSFGGPTAGLFRYNRPDHHETAYDVAIDSQGRILIAFLIESSTEPGVYWPTVIRLTPDGESDPTFGFLGIWSESTIPAFAPAGVALALDSSDRPLVGWTYEFDQGGSPNRDWGLRRLTVSGANDLFKVVAFDLNGSGPGTRLDHMGDLFVWWDGRVIAVGDAQWSGDDTDFAAAVWAPDLSDNLILDTSFDGDGRASVAFDVPGSIKSDVASVVAPFETGFILAGFAATPAGTEIAVARFELLTGALDPAFGSGGRARFAHTPLGQSPWPAQKARAAAESPGDSTVVLAGAASDGTTDRLAALKLDAFGGVVPSWGALGWVVRDLRYPGLPFDNTLSRAYAVAVDPAGGVLIAGETHHPVVSETMATLVRLTPLGAPDLSFSNDGVEQYAFEPVGEPNRSGFNAVALPPGPDPKTAIVAGQMFGVTGGTTRTDWDTMASRIFLDPTIFADDFESGNLSEWSATTP